MPVGKVVPVTWGQSSYFYELQKLEEGLCCCCSDVQSCLTLCDLMDCSPPGSFFHGISQARILEQVAISYSKGSSWPRDQTQVSCTGRQVLYHLSHQESPSWEILDWVKHKPELIARRNISSHRYADDTTLMAESEEELKRLLMKEKVENEKAG